MKAISIKQPWASLIVHGIKDIENRTWPCPKRYIGQRVLIHASKRKRWVEPISIFTREQFDAIRDDLRFIQGSNTSPRVIDSAIIGSVKIVDCVINHPSIWADKTEIDCTNPIKCGSWNTDSCQEGCINHYGLKKPIYNWVVSDPILYENPIVNVKGKLSFWEYDGIEEVTIECPECGFIQPAVVNCNTAPFNTYIHDCKHCGYLIQESEWNEVKETAL